MNQEERAWYDLWCKTDTPWVFYPYRNWLKVEMIGTLQPKPSKIFRWLQNLFN